MNPYPSMRDELEKISLGAAKIVKGVYKGLLGRGVPAGAASAQARGIGFYAKTKQRPRALKELSMIRGITPKRPALAKVSSLEKDAIGLFLGGLAARAATKVGPKLLKGIGSLGKKTGLIGSGGQQKLRKARGAITTHRRGLRRAGKGAIGVDTALGVGSMATGAAKSVGQPRSPVRVRSPA